MIEIIARDEDISPFHHGEQEVQKKLGVRDIEMWARKVVRSYLPEQHRDFHTSLPFPDTFMAGMRRKARTTVGQLPSLADSLRAFKGEVDSCNYQSNFMAQFC